MPENNSRQLYNMTGNEARLEELYDNIDRRGKEDDIPAGGMLPI